MMFEYLGWGEVAERISKGLEKTILDEAVT